MNKHFTNKSMSQVAKFPSAFSASGEYAKGQAKSNPSILFSVNTNEVLSEEELLQGWWRD